LSHRPRKRFGQNFLRDPGVIARILDQVAPRPGEHMVEIGPGRGALTLGLLQRCGELDAIELDRDLVPLLSESCSGAGVLRIHNEDALAFDYSRLPTKGEALRIVGNLPYNISTPLLFRLMEYRALIEDMHFMLQKEVVDRMAAPPGSRTYGRLSVTLQVLCRVEPLFDIPPEAFVPRPKVQSSFVRLTPSEHPEYGGVDGGRFARLVAAAFSQRRKTLRNSLGKLMTPEEIEAAGLDPGLRAEQIAPAGFLRLAGAPAWKSGEEA